MNKLHWGEESSCLCQRAQVSGKVLFSGVVDDLDSLLELHRCNTLCTFDIRTSVLKCQDCHDDIGMNYKLDLLTRDLSISPAKLLE